MTNRKGSGMLEMIGVLVLIAVIIWIMVSLLSDAGESLEQPVKESCSLATGVIGSEGFCANPKSEDIKSLVKKGDDEHKGKLLKDFGKLGCSQEEVEQHCFIWIDDPEYVEGEEDEAST